MVTICPFRGLISHDQHVLVLLKGQLLIYVEFLQRLPFFEFKYRWRFWGFVDHKTAELDEYSL